MFNLPFFIDIQREAKSTYHDFNLNSFPLLDGVSINLAQSQYAFTHLREKELRNILFLSDYLNDQFLSIKTDKGNKEDFVAYNSSKGFKFTRELIKAIPNIKFVPIKNMTRDEVIKLLQRAKVYIDFGNHPGKDRIPREAAILGCCVITGKRGGAAFYEDVSIPKEYKFDDVKKNIPAILDKIKDCFDNFEERYKDFDYYRQIIKEEPHKFIDDLRSIFVKV
jgi:hypothetical protein